MVLLVGVGIIWEFYYTQLSEKQLSESKTANQIVDITNNMEVDLYQTLIYLNLIHEVRTSSDPGIEIGTTTFINNTSEAFSENFDSFYEYLADLESKIDEKEVLKSKVKELRTKAELYESLSRDWLKIKEEIGEESHLVFLSSIAPYFLNNIVPNFEDIRSFILAEQEESIRELNNQIRTGRITNYSITGIILLIGVMIGVFLYRSIMNPLRELTVSVNKIGQGDLKHRTSLNSGDEFGYVGGAINNMAENLEKQTISSSYLDNVMESISEGIFVVDEEGNVKRLNDAGAELLEMDKEELRGKCINDYVNLIDPDDEKESRNKEYRLETIKHSKIPVLFSESDLMDNGQKIGTVLVVRDISELKGVENQLRKSLDEKDIMMAEIHHRVKNNLAVISGLLQLQIAKSIDEDVNKALTDSQLRIQSIALIHEKLYGNDSLAAINYGRYLKDLLNTIQETYSNEEQQIKVTTDVEDVELNVNQAIPCSLLINEVVVNAYKHAFQSKETGNINISIRENENLITIQIEDDGVGISDKMMKDKDSLGSILIETLTNQLDGTSSQKNAEGKSGSIFKLEFKKKG